MSCNITTKTKRCNFIFYDINFIKVSFSYCFSCTKSCTSCFNVVLKSMQIARQKHCYYDKTPLLLHYKSNGVCTKNVSICGAGGFRTHVQTGKYCAFYTFISAFICQIITRPEPPIITLVFKVSSKNQDLFRLFPIFLHH